MKLLLIKKDKKYLIFYLNEINLIPKESRDSKLSSQGFFDEITVQNFLIRNTISFITRRRWLNEDPEKWFLEIVI